MRNSSPRTLKTVETTCSVIDVLEENGGATVTEVAETLDISPGGAYNHLATLHEEGYLVKDNGQYELGMKFVNKGRHVIDNNILYRAGKEVTENLAEETGEFAHLMTCEHGRGVFLHKARGERGISQDFNNMKLKKHDYLHWGSTGKAYLAHLPPEEARRVVEEQGLPSMNENTITDPDKLFDEFETIREQGYAINDQEEIIGTRAIGAPIENNKALYGAISISGPKSRFTFDRLHDELSEQVLEAANIISVNITTLQNQ
ncbi:IclR family transcriptional regulator [Haloferax volcanii]|uniref:IclR family transcription regulator n=5 Tax=Haloferax TaxID=2251 RepID=D4H0F8_HALVD|nr:MULTISPECIES: IclR family transcriptional regulator [Haloferax]ADE05271.1 IclR family transcription regulator [Haloferax volcanii DS2]ELZ86909.1 ArcR family transcription regulator [Haloferax gibbonsii ATCC 33959]MBS8121202.1 IclR family transcriptional regulator [Haloferax volcanii]MBS8126212.1 IclR family transcriptional regulator [Haloferax volcanii]MBS8130081.1 IclR family transcriptional regulator [Haloferax volcanii]